MQDMEQTDSPVAAADDADPRRRRGGANPLSHAVRPFTRTGGFYARSWGTYLDREPSELPVARRTIALATHAFRDEIVLAAFRLQRPLPDAQKVERVNGEVTATLELYGEKGWLEAGGVFRAASAADRRHRPARQQHGPQLRAPVLRQRLRAPPGRTGPGPVAVAPHPDPRPVDR